MAITFSKSISTTEILNAYNNNVVEFTSNAIPVGKSIAKCLITIGTDFVTITPNANNTFHYNFKSLIKSLINTNDFVDSLVPTNAKNVPDSNLIQTYSVTYLITFTDSTTENIVKSYTFTKSANQIGNLNNYSNTVNQVISPTTLTLFKGYPFDLPVFSDGNYTLKNTTNGATFSATSTSGNIDRLFLHDGQKFLSTHENRVIADGGIVENPETYEGLFDINILQKGYNTLKILSANTLTTLTINVKDVNDGVYLKWANKDGGYSYWLFNCIYKDNVRVRDIGFYNTDFESIDNTYRTLKSLGKTSNRDRSITAEHLTLAEKNYIEDIIDSPQVDLYLKDKGTLISSTSWQGVELLRGRFLVENTKQHTYKLKLKININDYTLS